MASILERWIQQPPDSRIRQLLQYEAAALAVGSCALVTGSEDVSAAEQPAAELFPPDEMIERRLYEAGLQDFAPGFAHYSWLLRRGMEYPYFGGIHQLLHGVATGEIGPVDPQVREFHQGWGTEYANLKKLAEEKSGKIVPDTTLTGEYAGIYRIMNGSWAQTLPRTVLVSPFSVDVVTEAGLPPSPSHYRSKSGLANWWEIKFPRVTPADPAKDIRTTWDSSIEIWLHELFHRNDMYDHALIEVIKLYTPRDTYVRYYTKVAEADQRAVAWWLRSPSPEAESIFPHLVLTIEDFMRSSVDDPDESGKPIGRRMYALVSQAERELGWTGGSHLSSVPPDTSVELATRLLRVAHTTGRQTIVGTVPQTGTAMREILQRVPEVFHHAMLTPYTESDHPQGGFDESRLQATRARLSYLADNPDLSFADVTRRRSYFCLSVPAVAWEQLPSEEKLTYIPQLLQYGATPVDVEGRFDNQRQPVSFLLPETPGSATDVFYLTDKQGKSGYLALVPKGWGREQRQWDAAETAMSDFRAARNDSLHQITASGSRMGGLFRLTVADDEGSTVEVAVEAVRRTPTVVGQSDAGEIMRLPVSPALYGDPLAGSTGKESGWMVYVDRPRFFNHRSPDPQIYSLPEQMNIDGVSTEGIIIGGETTTVLLLRDKDTRFTLHAPYIPSRFSSGIHLQTFLDRWGLKVSEPETLTTIDESGNLFGVTMFLELDRTAKIYPLVWTLRLRCDPGDWQYPTGINASLPLVVRPQPQELLA